MSRDTVRAISLFDGKGIMIIDPIPKFQNFSTDRFQTQILKNVRGTTPHAKYNFS